MNLEGPTIAPKKEEKIPQNIPEDDMPPDLPEEVAARKAAAEKVEKKDTQSVLQKREVPVSAEKLSPQEASKKLLQEERAKLARELINERKGNRDKIAELNVRLNLLQMDFVSAETKWEDSQKKYQELSEMRAEQANSFAGRIKKMIGLEFEADKNLKGEIEQTEEKAKAAKDEKESLASEIRNLEELLKADATRENINKKLADHYAGAEEISQEQFEQEGKKVENSLIRDNVFILHTLTNYTKLRHNENSPVSKAAQLEDDIDILVSLEPSLSTSSVSPGHVKNLFQESFGNVGVIIGGGEIQSATNMDAGTVPSGIGRRERTKTSLEDVDKVLNNVEGGYNEIVVDNPKIFGIFKSVDVTEDGSFMIADSDFLECFNDQINMAHEKGIPQFVLTPDRRMFEFAGIDGRGKISVGREIFPADVAQGSAGLSIEDRKKIGSEVISKCFFKNVSHQEEAKKRIAGLSGEETEMSEEEYLENLRKYPEEVQERLFRYPESLRADESFMLKVAEIDPVAVLKVVINDGFLLKDGKFLKKIYSMVPIKQDDDMQHILLGLPERLMDKELILMAVEHNESMSGRLSEKLFNDPEIKSKIIDKMVEKFDNYALSNISGAEVIIGAPYFTFENPDPNGPIINYPILEDEYFMRRIREKYKGVYDVEPIYGDSLSFKKISS